MIPTLHKTLDFAHRMHAGISDWTGVPYITHPIAVMLLLPPECCEEDQHIALLHDVFEDCREKLCMELFGCSWKEHIPDEGRDDQTPIQMLTHLFLEFSKKGYSEYTIHGLRLLTRDFWPDFSYHEYVKNIANSGHLGAIWVKYSDNIHNTDPARITRLSPELQERAASMNARYERSKNILRERLGIYDRR